MKIANIKRRAKLLISLAHYFMLTILDFGRRVTGRHSKPKLTVLYYHGIPTQYRARFARQMEMLGRWGQVVPACYRGDLPQGRKPVALTFDDAFLSVAENALPELVARSFCSTIFVPVGVLGRHPNWSAEDTSDQDEIVMSPEQLKDLPANLVSIGSHSVTHPHLSQLDRDDARNEIEDSRSQLQQLTGRDIRLFAFPYGDHSPSVIESCRDAGYEFAFTIEPDSVDPTQLNMVRGRVKADPLDSDLEFFLKFNGSYAWMSLASSLKRRLRSAVRL
jgi:peptidoglycan/xylan/chitin deacetylase (PgdA/CDA1 family)